MLFRSGQKILAAAINTPVSVMETAGEGGAWGIALLASYMIHREDGETLDTFLNRAVFAGEKGSRMEPDAADVAGFDAFIERYSKGLPIERAAIDFLKRNRRVGKRKEGRILQCWKN